jgi:hypothetical protein
MRVDKRLTRVAEVLAAQHRDQDRPRTVVYLPRKDGDDQPLVVVAHSGNVLTVRYDPQQPEPPLPEGW